MAAKYTALADWRIAHLLTGEYYCPEIAGLVSKGLDKVMSMADRLRKTIRKQREHNGGACYERPCNVSCGSSRPASGAEHVLSHFWECKKLQADKWVEFHGKKTGVASVVITRLYHELSKYPAVKAHRDNTDWEAVKRHTAGACR